jgi:hypothetical protein
LSCSRLTVSHLDRLPWALQGGQRLETKFWRFEFDAFPLSGQFGIKGKAYPRETIPAWAVHVRDLWFEAYLCTPEGRVLAKDAKVFQSGPLENGVGFEFVLDPPHLGRGERFLTFGYSMTLTGPPPGPGDEPGPGQQVFFASESALSRF